MIVTTLHRLAISLFFLKIQTSQFPVIHIKLMTPVFKILGQETEQLFFLLRYETLC